MTRVEGKQTCFDTEPERLTGNRKKDWGGTPDGRSKMGQSGYRRKQSNWEKRKGETAQSTEHTKEQGGKLRGSRAIKVFLKSGPCSGSRKKGCQSLLSKEESFRVYRYSEKKKKNQPRARPVSRLTRNAPLHSVSGLKKEFTDINRGGREGKRTFNEKGNVGHARPRDQAARSKRLHGAPRLASLGERRRGGKKNPAQAAEGDF